jgi:AcrR family transcriptional regulator
MRYPPGYKDKRRKELLKSSAALVKTNGFAATGVDALMAVAGVTSGAFYSNFGSKNELLKAVIEHELSAMRDAWAANPHNTPEAWLEFELDRYLTLSHVQRPGTGCAVPALAAEIGRGDPEVKALFEQEQRKGVELMAEKLGSETLAWAVIAQMAGTIMMARAMPTKKAQQEVLNAGKRFLKAAVASMGSEL